jgi:hypothetical protein
MKKNQLKEFFTNLPKFHKAERVLLSLTLLISILSMHSCSISDKTKPSRTFNDTEVIEINLKGSFESIKASDVFEPTFEIIKLETNENSLVSIITDLHFTGEQIFIGDVTTNNFIIFNRNGQFERSITHTGRGPGEYLKLGDFCINETDSLIYIYDDMQMKLMTFDYELNFITEREIPFYAMHVSYHDNNFFFFTGQMERQQPEYQYELLITNKDLEIIEKLLPYPDFFNAIRGNTMTPTYNFDGNYIYWNSFDNEVFQLDKTFNLSAKYRIVDYRGHIFPDYDFYLERNDLNSAQVADEIWEKGYIYSQEFLENKSNLLMIYHQDGNHYAFINKETMEQWHAKRLLDDLGLGINATKRAEPIYMESGTCIYAIHYHFYDRLKDSNTNLNPVFNDFSMEDNPILVVLKLKEDPINLN